MFLESYTITAAEGDLRADATYYINENAAMVEIDYSSFTSQVSQIYIAVTAELNQSEDLEVGSRRKLNCGIFNI